MHGHTTLCDRVLVFHWSGKGFSQNNSRIANLAGESIQVVLDAVDAIHHADIASLFTQVDTFDGLLNAQAYFSTSKI